MPTIKIKVKNPESKLQMACVFWFNYQFVHYKGLLFAVPNGGLRSKITAKILKDEGVFSGVSDLILMMQKGGYGALCIEMKTEAKNSKSSENQKYWAARVQEQGYKYCICRTVEEFIKEVTTYLKSK